MLLKQSTAYTRLFKMISSSDHLSLKTGAAPVVNLSKAGAAFGAAGGAVTEIANGWYKVALNTTDTNTLGDLAYYITGTGADDTDFCDQVSVQIEADLATPTNITAGTITTVSGNVNGSVGSVTGAVGSVTGAVGSVTAAITLPSIPANWITAAGINAAALNGKGDWLLASSYVAPTNLTAAQIATGVWTDTVATDFTAALSVGKSVMNGVSLGTGLTIASVSGAVGSVTAAVTAGTVSDKTGYSLTQAFPTNFSALGISALGHITLVDTLTTYTGNTPQTGDAYARLGAPVVTVSADIAAIKSDTGTTLTDAVAIKTQTDKLAFTVANQVDANILSLAGDGTAATNLAKADRAVCRGTVTAGASTTSIPTSAFAPGVGAVGQFIGRTILFDATTATTALQGQASNITASTNSPTPTLTVTALTTAPSSGDTFSIV